MEKNSKNFSEKLTNQLNNFFNKSTQNEYRFDLPDDNSNNSSSSNNLSLEQMQEIEKISEVKNIFPSLEVSIEYIKVKYNTLINSDIILREFTLSVRNRQYKALLLFVDGMADSKLINDNVLHPLMLRNRANIYDGDQEQVVSEGVANNITVRKVKKFDLASYIMNCLMPQNTLKQENEFDKIISRY